MHPYVLTLHFRPKTVNLNEKKRPDLAFLKDVLYGCEEGEKDVLHFLYKENTENLKKVIDAVKKHPYMELFGE